MKENSWFGGHLTRIIQNKRLRFRESRDRALQMKLELLELLWSHQDRVLEMTTNNIQPSPDSGQGRRDQGGIFL